MAIRRSPRVGLRYLDLTYTFCDVSIVEEGEEFRLCLDPSDVPEELRRFIVERELAAARTIQLELFGVALPLRLLSVTFPVPAVL
jgi:hypothetical protein